MEKKINLCKSTKLNSLPDAKTNKIKYLLWNLKGIPTQCHIAADFTLDAFGAAKSGNQGWK